MAVMAHLRTRRVALLVASMSTLSTLAAFGFTGVAAATAGGPSCSGAVVVVGGTVDAESLLLEGVKERYREQGYEVINAPYPATIWPLGATGYDRSTEQGIASTASAISSYREACGSEAPVVVTGYSQGARIAGDVLAGIGTGRKFDVANTPDDPSDDVVISDVGVSGELYSDPRQAGDKTGRGIELSLIGIIPGLTMSGSRGADSTDAGFGTVSDRVVSVCIEGDPICDLPDPVYDPIGAIDGILGYQVKHFLYPEEMSGNPLQPGYTWAKRPVECADGVCMVAADSALAELVQGWARNLGYQGAIGDFLSDRPTIGLPFGIELANLQPVVRLVQGLLPPLPRLGYGAYLPDIFVFEDILQGIVTATPARFVRGVSALAASVRSIVLLPVNFVRYWAGALIGPVASEGGAVTILAADTSHLRSSTFARLAAVPDESVGPVRADEVGGSGPSSEPSAARGAEPDATDPSPAEQPPVGHTTDTSSGADTGTDTETDTPDADPAPAPPRDDDSPAVTDPSGSDVKTSGTDGHGGEDGERAGSSDTASDPDGPSPDPSEPDSDGGSEAGD